VTPAGALSSAIETERLDYLGLQPDGSVDLFVRAQRIKDIGAATPVGRVGRPDDVAEVAAFLAGDTAGGGVMR
jgi:NAD(P)-dependent dehydrogenase (short-subunit alcohol dehydrogenase family)